MGSVAGATTVVHNAFEQGTKTFTKHAVENVLKAGDGKAVNQTNTNVHKAAIQSQNSSVIIEYTTSIVYNASQNTMAYYVNGNLVDMIQINLNKSTSNPFDPYGIKTMTVIILISLAQL